MHIVHCSRTHKFYFSVTFSLKMSHTVLFTHLKIILLHYFLVFSFNFQFSAVSNRTLNFHFSLYFSSFLWSPISRLSLALSSLCLYQYYSSILKPFRFVRWNKIFQYRSISMYRLKIFRIYIYTHPTFIIVLHELCYFPQHFIVVINLL